jgi:hypothetical protein
MEEKILRFLNLIDTLKLKGVSPNVAAQTAAQVVSSDQPTKHYL